MKNKNIKTILGNLVYILAALIQISLVTIVFIIDNLTVKKAGVMRHIYSRRIQYEQSIYSSINLLKHSILATTLGTLFILLLLYAIKKNKSTFYKVQLTLGIVASFLVSIVINSTFFINMMSYPYFIIASELILLIQIIIIIKTIHKSV